MADMNPILELAGWHEEAALQYDKCAEERDETNESATAGDYRRHSARHRATAAALRELVLHRAHGVVPACYNADPCPGCEMSKAIEESDALLKEIR